MPRNRFVAATGLAVVLAMSAAPAAAQELEGLKEELRAMKERLATLEADKAERRRAVAAASVEAGDRPRSWKLPGTNTSLIVGGFAKLDVLWDLATPPHGSTMFGFQAGLADTAQIARLAVSGNNNTNNALNGGNFRFTARTSRIHIASFTPTDWGDLTTFIEADFIVDDGFTAASNLRLRHAFGTLGPVLAGHTWTVFRADFAVPETLDFSGPVATVKLRQAQLRYTHNFGQGLILEVSMEEPSPDLFGPAGQQGAHRIPDFAAALMWHFAGGAVRVAGVFHRVESENGTGSDGIGRLATALGWGVNAAIVYDVHPRVKLGAYGHVTRGAGKYYNFTSGFGDTFGQTPPAGPGAHTQRPILNYGGVVWARFQITDTVRANVAYGYALQDVKREVRFVSVQGIKATLANTFHYVWSLHGNVIWSPVPAVDIGLEYVHKFAAIYGAENRYMSRVQGSFKFRF
jgi:hypothetical protein